MHWDKIKAKTAQSPTFMQTEAFFDTTQKPMFLLLNNSGANPTTVNYNASVEKNYNETNCQGQLSNNTSAVVDKSVFSKLKN
jgi:hypothetical protein